VEANSISTFGGNPLAPAGALANLDYLLSHDLQANALARGRQMMAGLEHLRRGAPGIGDLRGKGLMIALEMVVPGTTTPDPLAAASVLEGCRRGGLLIGRGGFAGHVLRIAPPLSVSETEVDRALGAIGDALAEAGSQPSLSG
jgi:4-aminobutyrate aminotransferase